MSEQQHSLPSTSSAEAEFAAYIGIDWSDRKHDICLYDVETRSRTFLKLEHRAEVIHEWVAGLKQRYGGQPIAIGLEQKRGPLIYALSQYDFLLLYPINPRTAAKYRQAFVPSRAKDDPTDADLLLELLCQHRDKLTPWAPDSDELRKLRQLVESRRTLVGEKVRLTNRITAALKNYYPQVLDWFRDKDTHVFCEFVEHYPTLPAAQAASENELRAFFKSHRVVRESAIQRRLSQIQTDVPLTEDDSIIEPLQLLVHAWMQQLKVVLLNLQTFDQRIEALFDHHPDSSLFAALPGAGPHLAPRLLVAFGDDRDRYHSAQDLLRYAGIAPVKEKSGKKEWIHWRWSCPKFLRQTFVEWADQSRRHSFWAEAFYEQQRRIGKTHPMAIRALAFKWIRILFRCWQDRVSYDEAKYLMALKKKGSPLVQHLAK
ncbi:MAG: IS110 family transposase [Elainellaceae cyanobacterium]